MRNITPGFNIWNINRGDQSCACGATVADAFVIRFTSMIARPGSEDRLVYATAVEVAQPGSNQNTTTLTFVAAPGPDPTFTTVDLPYGHHEARVYVIDTSSFDPLDPDWDASCLFYREAAYSQMHKP